MWAAAQGALHCGLRDGSLQRGYRSAFAGAFIFVESRIGAFQELLRGFAGGIIGPTARKLQAGLHLIEFKLQTFQTGEDVANFVGATFREQGHEFIAAQTHGEIGAANGALQAIGEAFQHGVTGRVTVAVVNEFQAVQIHEENGERAAVALRAADFLREALFAGAAIVETSELIERRQFVDFGCESFYFSQRFHLVSNLVAQAHQLNLLIDQINAEDQNEAYQGAYGLIQIKRIGSFVVAEHRGEGERSHGQGEQENHSDGGGPQPPLPAVQMVEMLADFFWLKVRDWRTVVRPRRLSMTIRHRSSLVYD